VQGYERVLPYVLEDEPMSILLKALIDKGFGVVQQTLNKRSQGGKPKPLECPPLDKERVRKMSNQWIYRVPALSLRDIK